MALIVFTAFLILLGSLPFLHLLITRPRTSASSSEKKKLPPGSLGIPLVGESLRLLRAMRSNTGEQWLARRICRHGPISKLTLFGGRTVFVSGPAANKLVFTSDALAPHQPRSITRIMGTRNILELTGDDHRRVRGAFARFLRPEVLKKYVGFIEKEVEHHLMVSWNDKKRVTVLPLMKSLTFDIICSVFLGLERGAGRDQLGRDFTEMLAGLWSVPVNLPFTNFSKSLKASRRTREVIAGIIRQKKSMLEQGRCSPDDDLITYMLYLAREDAAALTEDEILDNIILLIFAGHDTSSILLTFFIRHLAGDPVIHDLVLHEQENIAKSKAPGEALTWSDINKMKNTWHVAMEILRMIPPLFGSFRRALEDVEFEGFLIPKGWQVFWASSVTQMDDRIFRDPEKFDPTRFESSSSSESALIPPYCFVAFGGGARMCPGYEFARVETSIMIHHLITRFGWRLCCKENAFSRDPMPTPAQGLPIEIEPRNQLQAEDPM